ncbi:septal ring lytic transglycosylase RlpA family protein [Erythrobacter sp. HL-111]|uniref:septal ring lytic transglycosylase RlpA family protein n=1 Tax=Erythrobacter sp. HL-111 TaxID=1798193 RepID=UPI0006DB8B22|nr:septal ring lytic transglycosylase RlpA family protein [Erythrobacter sp. HL-111]KPP92881.1 MAG: rare lipoprotein A [Erythrobacteraceae bacterium HL-111]SDT00017.1 Rare lipoprotein A (RlpA)-like double-psi beta-barrel [Erythrobacter sp. HL-111]
MNMPDSATPSRAMPSRRERLRVIMRLRSQRQLLMLGMAAFALLAIALAAMLWTREEPREMVRLGKGGVSVEAMAPEALPDPDEAASASEAIGGGAASYYGNELAGNPTASGELFDPEQLTAAHRTLPLGSKVRVTNPANGESVVVRINDRGPFHGNRVIDLSFAAAREIGLLRTGVAQVRMALQLD